MSRRKKNEVVVDDEDYMFGYTEEELENAL